MHYNTGRLTLPYTTTDLLKVWPDMEALDSAEIEVDEDKLPKATTVMLLKEAL